MNRRVNSEEQEGKTGHVKKGNSGRGQVNEEDKGG
jgi:hypothetical protein